MIPTYDLLLVIVSYIISVFGSYTGLQLVGQIQPQKKDGDMFWLTFAAISLGGGAIWSMHFIAMLAYKLPITVTYDLELTLLSMVVAIIVTGISLAMIVRLPELKISKLLIAGTIMGLGVASMHYMGMMAMQLAATMSHSHVIVMLSIAIAIVAATAALWIAFNVQVWWQKLISAFIMGIAVCGMHYTAMVGVTFTPNAGGISAVESVIFANELAGYIGFATFIVLMLGLVAVFAKEMKQARSV